LLRDDGNILNMPIDLSVVMNQMIVVNKKTIFSESSLSSFTVFLGFRIEIFLEFKGTY